MTTLLISMVRRLQTLVGPLRGVPQMACAIALGMGAIGAGWSLPAQAAEEVVFTFGPLARTIPVADLESLATTGEAPRSMKFYLNLANIDPGDIQGFLVRENEVEFQFIDGILNSLLGEYALFRVGQIVQTRSGQANIQALRSAVVMSALDDDRVTLLEFFQNYPTEQVFIDGEAVLWIAQNLDGYVGDRVSQIENWLLEIQSALAEEACDCDAPDTAALDSQEN